MSLAGKKVMIVRNAYNWQFGGAEKFTYNTASALRKNGINTVVVSNVPKLIDMCKKSNIHTTKNIWLKNETRRRFALAYYLLFPLLVMQYVVFIKRNSIDLIITSGRDEDIFATQAAKLLRKPVIWIDHADMKGILGSAFPFLQRLYFNSMSYANKIVAVSEYEKNMIFKNLSINKDKFVVINNGAIKLKGKKIQKPNKSIILGYVGRLEKDKGISELIYAISNLVNNHKNVYGWIAGEGSLKNEVLNISKKNKKIKYMGYLKNVYDMLDSVDIFIYPSYHDASPLAPVEALLSGAPVVASKVGGIPEVLDHDFSLLVEPRNKEELLKATERLINDKTELKKMAKAAKIAGKKYDFNTIFKEKYMPLISSVL